MRRSLLAALTIAALLLVGGVAYAAIPHSVTGVITGCYNNSNGSLKVIDAQSGATCAGNETTLTWNQTGPQGPQGPSGLSGVHLVSVTVPVGNGENVLCPNDETALSVAVPESVTPHPITDGTRPIGYFISGGTAHLTCAVTT